MTKNDKNSLKKIGYSQVGYFCSTRTEVILESFEKLQDHTALDTC